MLKQIIEFDLSKESTLLFPLTNLQGQLLKELAGLYEELEARITSFARQMGLSCPAGCGSCCKNFEPEILPQEAMSIAFFLYRNQQLAEWEEASARRPEGSCPLYLAEVSAHCSVYPVRPLVCRMFGFSGIYDKYGRVSYVTCNKMYQRLQLVFNREEDLRPPVMLEFSLRLKALQPTAIPEPLRKAVARALSKILWQSTFYPDDLGKAG